MAATIPDGDAGCGKAVRKSFVTSHRVSSAEATGDPDCDAADMNGDGLVDPLDVGFILARFGACG